MLVTFLFQENKGIIINLNTRSIYNNFKPPPRGWKQKEKNKRLAACNITWI